ncbi:MAG: enolase C-terminal domain-like protein, partial [Bryobacteraceae bacterium]
FSSDHDPARMRWFGPFSQLAGAILVQIQTDQGITGYGMGGGGGAACYIVENHLKDLLLDANALNVELLWDQIFASTSFYGRKGVAIQALSGIDLALWDIAGKHANLPVWRLLGGAAQEKTRAYFTGKNLELGMKLGFTAFKLPMELGPDDADRAKIVETLKAARNTVGPDALLMIDVLCRWNVPFTLDVAQRLADAGVNLHFIEEPILPDDIPGYAKLCREVKGTRIASGEHEYTHFGFDQLLRQQAAHFLQPDLTWSGGLTTGKRILPLAASHHVPVIPHRGGSVFAMQLIATGTNCPLAESFGTGEPGNEMMQILTAPFEKGFYRPPEGIGMGFDIPKGVLQKHGLL